MYILKKVFNMFIMGLEFKAQNSTTIILERKALSIQNWLLNIFLNYTLDIYLDDEDRC